MPLFHRIHLGPYEILASIDAGGMGEVYRAHDSRLNRFATKISDAQFAERFTGDARAIAVLDHTKSVFLERDALENEFFS